MADNIFGERFFGDRVSAWHGKGYVTEVAMKAVEALEKCGDYEVSMVPLLTPTGEETPYRAIRRSPTPDDARVRWFGSVSGDYALITPSQLATIWDTSLGVPVESMGALAEGRTFFITTRLAEYEVAKDTVVEYLATCNFLDGKNAFRLLRTPVRIVCQNTMVAGIEGATASFALTHNQEMAGKLGTWLAEMYSTAMEKRDLLKDLCNQMARTACDDEMATGMFARCYPIKGRPSTDGPRELVQRRLAEYESKIEAMTRRREGVACLWNGMATGYENLKGNVWGALQVVVEYEDHRPEGAWGLGKAQESALLGDRAATKEIAFAEAVKLSRN